ncbi:hypothetical protein BKA66DRAFT_419484 [Pyrenochaeta sp. MPI-SDFR-AT-0127]|nr:hypothetical protein BKA66DRAFT_419484 [Pyrenochaeta sp. MPI-SDFR-AT-0127]
MIGPVAMDIDHTQSPPVYIDSAQLPFTDAYENLPANGPVAHARIIDLCDFISGTKQEGTIKLQDAVVTTLYNVSPDALKSFLSPTVNIFKAVFGKQDTQLVVWRKGLEVFIGLFEHLKSLKVFGFEHVAGLLIGYDGSWHLKITANDAYSNPKWPEVWAGKFQSFGGLTKMIVEVEDIAMAKRASILAKTMLEHKYWELKTDIKIN